MQLIEDDDDKEDEDPANDEYESVLATRSKKVYWLFLVSEFALTRSQSKKKKKKKTKSAGYIVNEPHAPSEKSNKARPMKQEVSKSKGKQISRDVDFEKALEELSGK